MLLLLFALAFLPTALPPFSSVVFEPTGQARTSLGTWNLEGRAEWPESRVEWSGVDWSRVKWSALVRRSRETKKRKMRRKTRGYSGKICEEWWSGLMVE